MVVFAAAHAAAPMQAPPRIQTVASPFKEVVARIRDEIDRFSIDERCTPTECRLKVSTSEGWSALFEVRDRKSVV